MLVWFQLYNAMISDFMSIWLLWAQLFYVKKPNTLIYYHPIINFIPLLILYLQAVQHNLNKTFHPIVLFILS